jgi:hypothetical protein
VNRFLDDRGREEEDEGIKEDEKEGGRLARFTSPLISQTGIHKRKAFRKR